MSWLQYRHEFQTPPEVARHMVGLIPPGARTILEPTPGDGNILRELSGYRVTAPEDFFTLRRRKYDCVVMNPPFSHKYANVENAPQIVQQGGMRLGYHILTECMELSDSVIALMPWFTLSDSDLRLRAVMAYGLRSITTLPRKAFEYARVQTCILELSRGYTGPTEFKLFEFVGSGAKLSKL